MNVEWHINARTDRRFVATLLFESTVDAALSLMALGAFGWWLLLLTPTAVALANWRIRECIPLIAELQRQRAQALALSRPRIFRAWCLLNLAGCPVKHLRVAVLGHEPADIFPAYHVQVDGGFVHIGSEPAAPDRRHG